MSDMNNLTILFYPPFTYNEDFTDHYYRMIWYLNPLRERINRIIMPYEGEAPSVGALPYYLDPGIKQMAERPGIASKVELVSSEHASLLKNKAKGSDIVLVWCSGSGKGNRVPDGPLKPVVMRKKHYFVDHKREKNSGSFYLRLSAEICKKDEIIEECREKFNRMPVSNFSKTGYIFGTGPSLPSALEMDLSEGTSIVCNTIVKNTELMRKLKPPVITVADPIFHAGCSSYAGDFRRHLVEALAEFDSYLIVPMRDYSLYMANLDSSLRGRIIGIPVVPPNLAPNLLPNLNLYKKFQVTPATSILPMFLIPLAATFFKRTFVIGCDGRPLEQNDYFWKHDPASQLVNRMDDIQVAHPAFFEIDYNDHYIPYCELVARWLDEAERQGKTFRSLTPSYVPALKTRQVAAPGILSKTPKGLTTGQVHIISLNPQLIDSLGHPLAYDNQLNSTCTQSGVVFVSAASARLDPSLMESHPFLHAVFSDEAHKSGVVDGDVEPSAEIVERFRREVQSFIDEYLKTCDPEDKVILYLYTGGLPHIEVLYDIIKVRPQVSAHITLFFLGLRPVNRETLQRRWAVLLRKALVEARLALAVLTTEMQREIQEALGIVLPVEPAPGTSFNDVEARSILEQSELSMMDKTQGTILNVLFPGLMRRPKGYDLSISIARMLRKRRKDASYHCTLRYIPQKNTPPELVSIAHEARSFADVIKGILSPEEFKRMLKGADIIVLPYQSSEFANRPSGILIESLLCGIPVVVQKGTWLGNLVERYDCGVLAETARPKEYIKAIERVATNHRHYRKNAISAGKNWLKDNSWATLLNFIVESPPPLDVSQGFIYAEAQQKKRNVLGKVASRATALYRRLRRRSRYQRLVYYLQINYPLILAILRFSKWCLAVLKRNVFGVGGAAIIVIAGLFIAGALVEPGRWYLIGVASILLVMGGGLFILSYARLTFNRIIGDQKKQISIVKKQILDNKKQILDNKEKILDNKEKMSDINVTEQVLDIKNTLEKVNIGNFIFFQPFNRQITKQNLKHFAIEWMPKLGLALDVGALAYIAHHICLAEDKCVGRLGGNIETMLLRVLIARSVIESKLDVLEIGTLFGVGIGVIHEYCRVFFNNVHISVIDPLSGYYDKGQLDPTSKIPVTHGVFVDNMRRMDIPESDYTIIQKLSTEDEALEQASKRRYNLLIIDGDHSYSGVKHDLYNYRYLVNQDGYIIFDDYDKPEWPGIKNFVDDEVVGLPGLELVGTDFYTAVFRVIATQDPIR